MSNNQPRQRASRRARYHMASAAGLVQFLQPVDAEEICSGNLLGARNILPLLNAAERAEVETILKAANKGINQDSALKIKAIVNICIDDHWHRLATAWRVTFSEAQRCSIKTIVDHYFDREPFERGAPFVLDVEKHLVPLEQTAHRFQNALIKSFDNPEDDAAFQARRLIVSHLPEGDDRTDWQTYRALLDSLGDFISACERARMELKEPRDRLSHREGRAWQDMIFLLSELGRLHHFPVTISKGRKKWRDDGPPSRFVEFVWALQDAFPPCFRRPTQSKDALATAMSKAIRERRNPRALIEEKARS